MTRARKPALAYLSVGAGVQSSTIAEMIALGELPPPDVAIFSDLHDEPDYVYRQVAYLKGRLATRGVLLITLSQPPIVDILLSDTAYTSIPAFVWRPGHPRARIRRQCTNQFKVDPIQLAVKSMLAERGLTRKRHMKTMIADVVKPRVTVECWLGISLDEVHRMKPGRKPWIANRWPLIDLHMTRAACIQWLTDHALPIPGKSNCRICPYHRSSDWLDMAQNRPADFAHVCHIEDQLIAKRGRMAATLKGDITLSDTGLPLRQLVTALRKGQTQDQTQPPLLDICDEGFCWT